MSEKRKPTSLTVLETDLRTTLKVHEKRYPRLIDNVRLDMKHTAKVLGIGLSTLYRKIKELKIK